MVGIIKVNETYMGKNWSTAGAWIVKIYETLQTTACSPIDLQIYLNIYL